VDISGTTAIIGATGAGAAYVFELEKEIWTKKDTLIPSTLLSDKCGTSVAVSGSYALVGCPTNGTGKSMIMQCILHLNFFR
jgi:hypothetical protein